MADGAEQSAEVNPVFDVVFAADLIDFLQNRDFAHLRFPQDCAFAVKL
jgi:hypothetical protein